MEDDLIESVARAIYEAGADPAFRWELTADTIQAQSRVAARAAVKAAADYLESIERHNAAFALRDPAPPRKRHARVA